MPFAMDPEVAATMAQLMGSNPPPQVPVGDVQTRRQVLTAIFQPIQLQLAATPAVSRQTFSTRSEDGTEIALYWYSLSPPATPGPAVLYIHGGGMISLSVDVYDGFVRTHVQRTGVPFLFVEYRLAPEARAPAPVQDAFAALQYLAAHAGALGVDPARIGVMGDSAGGGIAASLALYSKLHAGPALARQILIYPMLDDRNTTPDPLVAPFATWSCGDNITGWGALLGDAAGKAGVPAVHAAGRMTVEEARGLPSAYIDVGELDVFRDEDLDFARTLGRAGVSVEFHLWRGVPHAFEVFAPEAAVSKRCIEARYRAVGEL